MKYQAKPTLYLLLASVVYLTASYLLQWFPDAFTWSSDTYYGIGIVFGFLVVIAILISIFSYIRSNAHKSYSFLSSIYHVVIWLLIFSLLGVMISFSYQFLSQSYYLFTLDSLGWLFTVLITIALTFILLRSIESNRDNLSEKDKARRWTLTFFKDYRRKNPIIYVMILVVGTFLLITFVLLTRSYGNIDLHTFSMETSNDPDLIADFQNDITQMHLLVWVKITVVGVFIFGLANLIALSKLKR